jgi:rubrerythrin
MGLFKKLGRRVEQFKQDAQAATEETTAEGSAVYHCETCEARFTGPREQCPECGSDDIASVQPTE